MAKKSVKRYTAQRSLQATEGLTEPDPTRALDLVMQLLAIEGPSGRESKVARFITAQLSRAGVRVSDIHSDSAHLRTPIRGDTGNLFFHLPGTFRAPRRLLMAHMDTVPLCVGSHPVRRGNLIRSSKATTGVGADDRAGAAVVLNTSLEIVRRGLPHPPLTFLWTVQEETGLHGARLASLSLLRRPVLAFNWDGGSPAKLTIGATGGYRMTIQISGRASHAGGAPERGVSAIVVAARAIAQLHEEGWHGAIRKSGCSGTSNVGVIEGGNATNVVPDSVRVRAEARSHDPRFRAQIVRQIEKSFQVAARSIRNDQGIAGKVQFDGQLDYESFCLDRNAPCVQVAQDAIRRISRVPELAVSNGGLDANWLFARGIPTVTLGCGQRDQHTVAEALDVSDFQDACRIALRLATGPPSNSP